MSSAFTELRHLFRGFDGRISAVEAKVADEPVLLPEERDHSEIFCRWLRQPTDHGIKQALQAAEDDLAGRVLVKAEQDLEFANWRHEDARKAAEADFNVKTKRLVREAELETIRKRIAFEDAQKRHEVKDITIGTGASGGFAVPKEIASRIDAVVKVLNPFRRRLARIERAGSSDFKFDLDLGDDAGGWVSETGTRTKTATPTLRQVTPTFGELYALPQASEWSLDDIFFDVESWLARSAGATFAAVEAEAVVNGNGSAQLSGLLNTSPSATVDGASPARADDQLQFISTGSPSAPTAGDLSGLIEAFSDGYLQGEGIGWVMHRSALAMVRTIQFPNATSFQDGAPPTLYGFPVATTDAMDAPGGSGFPIAFGSWPRGYGLVDLGPMRITADPVSQPGFVSFYLRRRVGGKIIDHQALKLLQF